MLTGALEIEYRRPGDLVDYEQNSRTHSDEQLDLLEAAMFRFGFTAPVALKDDRTTIGAGHARTAVARRILERGDRLPTPDGETIPTVVLVGLTDEEWRAYVIADNRIAEMGAGWNIDALRFELTALTDAGFDLTPVGFDLESLATLELSLDLPSPSGAAGAGGERTSNGSLSDRFGVPPFSVLNAREGWWQDRKRAWIALGIKSELGRGEGSTYGENTAEISEPGLNHYRNRKKADAKALHDGAVKGAGRGGLADQVAANATARRGRKPKAEAKA